MVPYPTKLNSAIAGLAVAQATDWIGAFVGAEAVKGGTKMMVEKTVEQAKEDKETMQAEQGRKAAERFAERVARLDLEYAAPPRPSQLTTDIALVLT